MDCPSEENLIRLKLDDLEDVQGLEFDLERRELLVFHLKDVKAIDQLLSTLDLGSALKATEETDAIPEGDSKNQKKLLWWVLVINLSFFVLEMLFGLISKSMGLVADSLDMLADAFVYAISLMAVGKALSYKKNVALLAGYFQITLAVIGVIEVFRRFIAFDAIPDISTMIIISSLALAANSLCLYLLQKSKSKKEVHMKASMIFTANDIIINSGVILAAVLVYLLKNPLPDLIIGSLVFLIVIRGAIRILKLGK